MTPEGPEGEAKAGSVTGVVSVPEPPAPASSPHVPGPPTRREGSVPTPVEPVDEGGALAERPTQLDTGRREGAPRVPTGTLKQAGLVRADGSSGDSGPSTNYVGYIIDGRYRIEGVLGRGGMGVVYRARHEVIDKLAAIKILLPTEDVDVVDRFVNEAKAATAIGNAHIVDTVDFGVLPDASTYFVMEYLDGQTLARRIKKDKFVEIPRAIAIARQIIEGIEAAHLAGIVHRDLKPENIFLTTRDEEEDFVKLLDFGIAKVQNAQNRITRAGTIFGTPHYMSPEQAAGTEVDPRTDIYSLGVILYEMLAGRVPFDAENPMGLLTQHMYTEPTPLGRVQDPPQHVPETLDAIVLKCLAKKPEDRYATMADVEADLDRLVRGVPPLALADLLARAERDNDRALIAAAKLGMRGGRRSRLVTFSIAGAIGATALAGIMLVVALRDADTDPRQEESVVPPVPSPPEPAAPAPVAKPKRRAVALVFQPIDGEVFRDGKSLGGMPVNVEVALGETVEVEVRRDGFFTEKVRLDGAAQVVPVYLRPIPGVQPRVPVPSAKPLEELKHAAEVAMRPRAEHHADAGARRHRSADAGAGHAPAPPASAPPPAEPPAETRTPPAEVPAGDPVAPAPPAPTPTPSPAPSPS
jgi:hypothetical protein